MNLTFQLVSASTLLLALYLVVRRRLAPIPGLAAATLIVQLVIAMMAQESFHAMRLLAWFTFLHLPVGLLAYAVLRRSERRTSLVALGLAATLAIIGVYAFLFEPTRLEVSRHQVEVTGLEKPLRIVVLADIQTDEVGEYEHEVFDTAMKLEPDLVLLAGDYLQIYDSTRGEQVRRLRELMMTLTPPLGAWAVRGNVDPEGAGEIFRGTPVTYLESTRTVFPTDGVALLGLSLEDSFSPQLPLPRSDHRLRIVFGHAPDFSLGTKDETTTDLFFAGHTHGGQVQLPFVGPLITYSAVPRAWAGGGLVHISERRKLVVSRGTGMERGHAPRLRFLCRPEIVVLDLTGG